MSVGVGSKGTPTLLPGYTMTSNQLMHQMSLYFWQRYEYMKHIAELDKALSMVGQSIHILGGDNDGERRIMEALSVDEWKELYGPYKGS